MGELTSPRTEGATLYDKKANILEIASYLYWIVRGKNVSHKIQGILPAVCCRYYNFIFDDLFFLFRSQNEHKEHKCIVQDHNSFI